ncbi:MAG: hypothetical protein ABIQ77_03420 [Anaerolineales bacterium]
MSKPIAKVTFSVLIALALIVGIYSTVQGAFSSAGTRSGQAHVDAGLNADLNHPRSSAPALSSFELQADSTSEVDPRNDGGCDSESKVDPND